MEGRLKEIDVKLEEMDRYVEMSRLECEISRLEEKLQQMRHDTGSYRSMHADAKVTFGDMKQLSPSHSPRLGLKPMRPDLTMDDQYVTRRRRKPQPETSTPRGKAEASMSTHSLVPGKTGTKVKPATYDGTGSWLDYKAHFDVCAELNQWSERDKGLYLAVSLRGQAQGVFGNLADKSKDYKELVKALEDRFAPPHQTELHRSQLKERRQRASETLSALGQDIKRLVNLAYPTAPNEVRETLAKEHFIDALLSSDMRLRIKQARPKSLNDAIQHAVELEAFNRAERRNLVVEDHSRVVTEETEQPRRSLEADVKKLQETVEELGRSFNNWKRQGQHRGANRYSTSGPSGLSYFGQQKRKCFQCGKEDHLKRQCPSLRQTEARKNPREHKAKGAATVNAGLFAECKINGVQAECLIDTGATLSIISKKAWDTVRQHGSSDVVPFNSTILSASSDRLVTYGKAELVVEISGVQCIADLVIADIENDVILGLDFLKDNNCHLDLTKDTLYIKEKSCKLVLGGKLGCFRVTVAETVTIPPRSEMIISGKVTLPVLRQANLGIVEPVESISPRLVAKSLVHSSEQVPIRIMNIGEQEEKIYTGTHIANLSLVSEVNNTDYRRAPVDLMKPIPGHLKELYERTITGMNRQQREQVANLLTKYSSTFAESDKDLGRTGIIKHKINTRGAAPIRQPLRRVPHHMMSEVDDQIDDMLDRHVIQPSSSPWAGGIVMVQKKDGTKRFCVDCRRLNEVTEKDAYPLPRIDESLDRLSGAEWFSCVDLNSGYWQVEVDEADRYKTAFTSRRGLFEFRVMPFGLCNAPATFERLMELVLAGLNWEICLIYLDDIIIIGKSFGEMVANLDRVLGALKKAGLKLKPRKCKLFAKEVEFLGHVVSKQGITTDPKKTAAVKDWPVPKNVKQVRSFVGFCSYYRRFIPNFATVAKPLHRLSEKQKSFEWTQECEAAFSKLKEMMTQTPILAHPDFSKHFILDTDASDVAIGAVLSQEIDGHERVIAYASRTLSKAERRYCVTRKELLALVHFVKHFRHYLYGKMFKVRTDHGSLRWLMKFRDPEGQVAR